MLNADEMIMWKLLDKLLVLRRRGVVSYEGDLVHLGSQLKFPVTEHDTPNDATDRQWGCDEEGDMARSHDDMILNQEDTYFICILES